MSGSFSRSFLRLNVLWFFAQRECPIHFSEFPVPATFPQRFCNSRQTSVLFRLRAIIFYLRLHDRHSAAPRCWVNVQVRATVPGSAVLISAPVLAWIVTLPAAALFGSAFYELYKLLS